MTSSIFSHNSVQDEGAVSLFSVEALIYNCTFLGNEAVASQASGGGLYIACTTPCLGSGISTNITMSQFLYNSADKGFGGGIYINSYPGEVNVDNSKFVGNIGLNGGGISSTSTVVRVQSSMFDSNIAYEGGGAVFWIYKQEYPTILVNVTDINNQASYGPYHATDLTHLNTSYPVNVKQVSGSQITVPINVTLLDYYGQIITSSSLYDTASTTIYCSVYRDTGVIKGSSIVASKRGVATFDELVITGVPGLNTTLRFSVPISIIADTFQAVVFRECISGEITVKVNPDSDVASCQKCTPGLYSFDPSDTVCTVCPSHVSCPGGNVLDLEKDYWRVDQNSATILPCPVPDVCLGGTNTSIQCREGHTGPYCTVCKEDYTKSSSGDCYSCNSSSDTAGEILSTVLFMVVAILVFVGYKYRKTIVQLYSSKMKVAVKNRKLRSMNVKIKIVIAFAQIIYQLGPAFNIVYPLSYLQYLNFYSIFQLNLLLLPNVNCMVKANYYDTLVFTTLSPFFLFIFALFVIQFMVIRAKRLNERNPSYTASRALQDSITVSFLISYFVLVNASTKVFQVFQCEKFDNGESYLVADYSIDCNAPDRSFYLSYGSLMIMIYPVGIPMIYAVILFRNRKLINPDWRKVIDTSEKSFVSNKVIQKEKIKVRATYREIKNIKNLYESYVPKRWYFELFDCARRLCLGAVPVLIFRGSTLQIIIVLLISLFSVATFMYFNPYIHSHDNHLAILAQWSITLVVISALIIKVQAISQSDDHTDGLGGVLIFLNLAIIVFSISTALMNTKETADDDPTGLFGEDLDDDDEEDEEVDEEGQTKEKKKRNKGEEDVDVGSEVDEDDDMSLDSDDEYANGEKKSSDRRESEEDHNDDGKPQWKGIFQKNKMRPKSKSIQGIELNPLHGSPLQQNRKVPSNSISVQGVAEGNSRNNSMIGDSIRTSFSMEPSSPGITSNEGGERRSTASAGNLSERLRPTLTVRDMPDSDDDEDM